MPRKVQVSIPIIVWGSRIVLKLMERFPLIITLGAMLLGYIAGQMAYFDPALKPYLPAAAYWSYVAAVIGDLFVLATSKVLHRYQKHTGSARS